MVSIIFTVKKSSISKFMLECLNLEKDSVILLEKVNKITRMVF